MEELVRYIVAQLVLDENSFKVEALDDNGIVVINVYVAKAEIGKVIGKQGRIARAIRSIVRASAIKQNIKCSVEIIEKEA